MKTSALLGRFSLFIIYFWFGILKFLGFSPAEALVQNLYNETIGNLIDFSLFFCGIGIFECMLGVLWLYPKLSKISLYFLIVHMITTFLPFLVLTEEIWQSWFTPTLVGQYIIKNLALISLAMFISKNYEQEQLELKRVSKSLMKFEGFTGKLVS